MQPQASLCGLALSHGPCQDGLTAFCLQLGKAPEGLGPPLATMERESWHESDILHFQKLTVVKGRPWRDSCSCEKDHSFIHLLNRFLLSETLLC